MEVKFEEQFKYCDESNVNAVADRNRTESKNPYVTVVFVISYDSIYCFIWQTANHRHSTDPTALAEQGAGRHKHHDPQPAAPDQLQMMDKWQRRG
jgi:hypothetical protein